ncbi:hypothetical protein [Serratia marcescens]|uniref:hypothetical protein n=1 Tax=Serratia marcescens TaxID=615 RepID=UPI000B6CC73F|nr:hypothetical protein [Serratia marcescens]OUI68010.1 hypothetical protein AZZ99_002283 [Serratia marcescens]
MRVRDRTKLQYELRTGHASDDRETRIQNASDNIAKNFAKTLFGVDLSSDPNAPLPDAPPTSAKVSDINTGSGDDTISVPRGWQNNAGNYGWTVIDGGSGHDTVDYSSLSHEVNLKFDAQGSYDGRGVIEKNGIGLYGFKDGLYNIEAVKLTDFKDNATFNVRVLTPANGLEVNLGKGSSEIRFEHGYTTAPGGSVSAST